jgi:hypothetical protein
LGVNYVKYSVIFSNEYLLTENLDTLIGKMEDIKKHSKVKEQRSKGKKKERDKD